MKRLVPILAALLVLQGCHPNPIPVTAAAPYVRLAAVPGRPAAGYFDLPAADRDDVLLSVTSPQAGRVEMHESMINGNMSSMRPLDRVPVRAGQQLSFAPGGRHLMLYDLAPTVRAGGEMIFVLHFEHAPVRTLSAAVQSAGGSE